MGFGTMLAAGLNLAAPALCLLGIGVLVLGVRPRAVGASPTGCSPGPCWSRCWAAPSATWLLDTSLFHQMAAAPATMPDWTSGGVMVALGALGAALGILAFSRRDLAGD